MPVLRGVAQLGLERLLWEQEVAGSNPVTPIVFALLTGSDNRAFFMLKEGIFEVFNC